MFDFKDNKKEEKKNKILIGAKTFILIGLALILFGSLLILPAFALNVTAINEAQILLNPEIEPNTAFHIFWIIFLLIMLAVFMAVAFARRLEREMVFFSISAVIVSFMITFLFISPIDFDIQQVENTIIINANNTAVTSATITNTVKQMVIIPADSDFRMMLSLLFTGLSLFNGFYAIMIITQFSTKGTLDPNGTHR